MKKRSQQLIEFNNVSVCDGDGSNRILDRIRLTIVPGENVAILGPNGAGKSSLIKLITHELYPVSWEEPFICRVWGRESWHVFDLRKTLGIVTNALQFTCTRDLTGMDMVLSGFFSSIGLPKATVTTRMRRKAREIVDFLEVTHLAARYMSEMSSGEARRFLIGRALVHDPRALILDEPATSLDLHALHKFRGILRKIARAGISIVLVTHTLQDIVPEISRIVMLKKGRIIADGPKERVLTATMLKRLYDVQVRIRKSNGYYYVVDY